MLGAIQVPQQADLRAVGDHLAVDVHHQGGHGLVGVVLALRPEGLEEGVVVEGGHAVAPETEGPLEEGEGLVGGGGEGLGPPARVEHDGVVGGEGADGERRVAEEGAGALAEDVAAHVRDPPCDGGHRRDRRLHRQRLRLQGAVGIRAQRPGAVGRLPPVLVVGEPDESRPQVHRPVEVQLVAQCLAPCHAPTVSRPADVDLDRGADGGPPRTGRSVGWSTHPQSDQFPGDPPESPPAHVRARR